MTAPARQAGAAPPSLAVVEMRKTFGPLVALDDVSVAFAPGSFHAILGENGAGKSTLVKCIMGYYHPDGGRILVDGAERRVASPRDAHRLGLGMVYQHFTLVPSMTVAENLVLGRQALDRVIDWKAERARIEAFQATMPFQLDPDGPVYGLAAGERQKLEILKQLYLGHRVLILDEPTTVLTPAEADEILGMMARMAAAGEISVILITHKFREVLSFAREVTVLRGGRRVGGGAVGALGHDDLVRMMIGREDMPKPAARAAAGGGRVMLEARGLTVRNDKGLVAVDGASLAVAAGEIVGVAGVSGNGQRELVEALAGQRAVESGTILVAGKPYGRTRGEMRRWGVYLLPEEPLRNGCVRSMSVAENLAFRNFDRSAGPLPWALNRRAMRRQAAGLIVRYGIKTQGPDARLETLSGGNIQRVVLARELNDEVSVLIAQNPCFGLDVAAVADVHNRIMSARNGGAAVLLISEDLDELLALADRILVMFEGELVYETPREAADVATIGRHMASRRGTPAGGAPGIHTGRLQ